MTKRIAGKTILITGGTGSWGNELVRQLLERFPEVAEIRIYSRGEHKQVAMQERYAHEKKLKFIIGDIRDKNILNYAMKGVHMVFHLAALKHVPICENNTWEAVLTNVNGTQNVVDAAIANDVEFVVDVSTDKAVEPFNLYGMTKAVGEKLMINANFNYTNKSERTKFICIRGGNVIGTNGSVIPLFKKQLRETNSITVTDPSMTRYLMSTTEAIGLIFTAVEHAIGGELFVMNMPATSLSVISSVMIDLFGNSKSTIRHIGVRPGEKKDEVLISKNEAAFTRIFSDMYYVIFPQIQTKTYTDHYRSLQKLPFPEFTSANARQLAESELKSILEKESWLWK